MGLDATGSSAGGMQNFGMGLSLLGSLGSAFGATQQGQAGSDKYKFAAAVYRNNKLIADQAAQDAIRQGQETAQASQLKTAATIGQQRAALAANGIQVDTDTAVEAMVDAARIGNMDQETIQRNAERQALALKLQGVGYELQAQMYDRAAKDSRQAGNIGGITSLLGGAGNVASKWLANNPASTNLDFSGTNNSTINWNDSYSYSANGWGGDL